ncbi:uncharacterized protein LOC135963168 [Calliphora vicina]|uniref:uncharacterized protein LOC135963168 n=1 Tax=Calliphora vicina TaxID=7373 RepID=UPI00325B0BA8
MQLEKRFELGIFIGALNIFVYFVGVLNIIATFIFEITLDKENEKLSYDTRDYFYITFYKIFLLMYSLIMIVTSVNLIKGIIKKSNSLIVSWLVLSFSVVIYQALFLLDQVIFCMAYGYTLYSPIVLLGLCILFVIQIEFLRNITHFSLDLYRKNILHNEEIFFVKNSSSKSENYQRNLTYNDSSVLTPLNEEDLKKQYSNCNSVNLNQFDI